MTATRIDEIADGIYRINTPLTEMPGGFSFNQYLVVDEEPLLYHTGPRRLFPGIEAAINSVMPISKLRWAAFSHVEADECGALNQLLAVAPDALPMCGQVAAMVSVADLADRPPRALADGETFSTGKFEFQWMDTPHLPHGWDAGLMFEKNSGTLFCGDLFTQPGAETPAVTEGDILGPSEAFRGQMDYFSHGKNLGPMLDRIAATKPKLLACMHGSAWRGDGEALLTELGKALNA
jgi:flavorubredoxin